MKKETYAYPSTMARLRAEYKIFLLAFVFIVIADSIGQIQVPLGPGTLILFPIFYSLIMGVLSAVQVGDPASDDCEHTTVGELPTDKAAE